MARNPRAGPAGTKQSRSEGDSVVTRLLRCARNDDSLAEQLLDDCASAGEIDDPGVALAQQAHDPAHVLCAGGGAVGDRGPGRGGDLLPAHLLWQEALDDGVFGLLLLPQLGAVPLAA